MSAIELKSRYCKDGTGDRVAAAWERLTRKGWGHGENEEEPMERRLAKLPPKQGPGGCGRG